MNDVRKLWVLGDKVILSLKGFISVEEYREYIAKIDREGDVIRIEIKKV